MSAGKDGSIYSDQQRFEADAHGQTALVLVESLIHELIERSVLSVENALGLVGVATEVQVDAAEELGDPPEALQNSIKLLEAIAISLRTEIPDTSSS